LRSLPVTSEEGSVQVPQPLTYSFCMHPVSHLLAATPALVLQPTPLCVMCQVHLIAFLGDKSIGKSLSVYDCERKSMQLYWGIEDIEKAGEMKFMQVYYTTKQTMLNYIQYCKASHSFCYSHQTTAHCHSPPFPSQLLNHPLAVLMFCDIQSRCQWPHIIKDFDLCRAWAFPAQLSQP